MRNTTLILFGMALLGGVLCLSGCGTLDKITGAKGYYSEESVTYYLTVTSTPTDASIYVNDRLVGRTTCSKTALFVRFKCSNDMFGGKSCVPDEMYILRVSKTGYKDSIEPIKFEWNKKFTYQVPKKIKYHFDLEKD